jgi:hypothetical protein
MKAMLRPAAKALRPATDRSCRLSPIPRGGRHQQAPAISGINAPSARAQGCGWHDECLLRNGALHKEGDAGGALAGDF